MSCLVFPASHALSSQQLMHKLPAKHNDDSAHDFQPSAAAPTSLSGESNEVQGQQPLRRAGEGGAGVRRASTSQAGSPPEVGHASDQEDRRCTRCRSFPRRPGRCRRRPVGQVTLVRQLEAAAAQGLCSAGVRPDQAFDWSELLADLPSLFSREPCVPAAGVVTDGGGRRQHEKVVAAQARGFGVLSLIPSLIARLDNETRQAFDVS